MKTILVDAVDAFVIETENGSFEIFQLLYEMLEGFPNKKIILTGANDEQYKEFGLGNMPYEVFTLKHDPEKTNPEYYRRMLAKFDLKPQEVVYFEHNPKAVESARSIGIETFFWDNNERPLSELKAFLENKI